MRRLRETLRDLKSSSAELGPRLSFETQSQLELLIRAARTRVLLTAGFSSLLFPLTVFFAYEFDPADFQVAGPVIVAVIIGLFSSLRYLVDDIAKAKLLKRLAENATESRVAELIDKALEIT